MKKHLRLIIASLITLLIAGAGVSAWWLQGRIMETLDRHEAMIMDQENQQQALKKLPELSQDYQDIQSKHSELDIVYSEDQVVEAIQSIEALAKAEGVQITIDEFSKPVEKKTKSQTDTQEGDASAKPDAKKEKTLLDKPPFEHSLTLELSTQGSYSGTLQFLHKLETTPFALDITAIDLSLLEGKSEVPSAPANDNPFLLTQAPVTVTVTTPQGVTGKIDVSLYTK